MPVAHSAAPFPMNGGARLLSRGLGRLADVKIAGVEIVSVLVLGVLPFALGVLVGQRSEVMEGLVDSGAGAFVL